MEHPGIFILGFLHLGNYFETKKFFFQFHCFLLLSNQKNMQRVFNFSGGRTSAYMVIRYYRPGDIVLFCDTGREHPATYKFINDFELFEKIPIIKIAHPLGFSGVLQKEMMIPNKHKRKCTIELKIKTARRYLRSQGVFCYENFIGFRYDEIERVKKRQKMWNKVFDKFPLYDEGIEEEDIQDFWTKKEYDLQIPKILGNCVLCFLKGKNAIIKILSLHPEFANEWIKDEEKSKERKEGKSGNGYTYFKGVTIKELLEFSRTIKTPETLDNILPAYNCNCTS